MQYEQQIKEHQTKLEQYQNIQTELNKLQEEKDLNEKKSNETINTLKHDYDILKTEFTELQDRGLASSFFFFFCTKYY